MKKSDVVCLASVAVGVVGGGAGYWIAPTAPWWAYVLVGLLVAGVTYQSAIRTLAAQAVVDGNTVNPERRSNST